MKTILKVIMVLALMWGAHLKSLGQGYIVPNGVIYYGFDGFGYQMDVIQNPTNSDYTGFSLIPAGKTPANSSFINTFQFSYIVDEGVRVFIVSSNQPMCLQPVLNSSYLELSSDSYIFPEGVPFYLGFYTGYMPWLMNANGQPVVVDGLPVYTGIYSRPVFGWGLFLNRQGAIQLIDSAVEIEGGGIYVGTKSIIAVPEPSAFTLMALGIACCFLWRKRSALSL